MAGLSGMRCDRNKATVGRRTRFRDFPILSQNLVLRVYDNLWNRAHSFIFLCAFWRVSQSIHNYPVFAAIWVPHSKSPTLMLITITASCNGGIFSRVGNYISADDRDRRFFKCLALFETTRLNLELYCHLPAVPQFALAKYFSCRIPISANLYIRPFVNYHRCWFLLKWRLCLLASFTTGGVTTSNGSFA